MARDEAYYEAEKRIEEARRSGATELDLRNMKLTELPESIGQLIHLKRLDVGHDWGKGSDNKNRLTALPESLGRLAQLQALNLGYNQLTALPEWLGQLAQLQSLDIPDNQLTALPRCLGQLTQLQSLNLNSNQLTALPEWLGQLTQLKELQLASNQLTSLPKQIGQLTFLSTLVLQGNPLVVLPETILKCVNLKFLDLMSTTLTYSLVNVVSQLSNLVYLNIWHCKCNELPIDFLRLTNLVGLYAGDNGFTSLPDEISQLKGLIKVVLRNNNLNDIPTSFTQLEHLEDLSLDDNPLNPELAKAYEQGTKGVMAYLRAKAEAGQITLNEAKLILVGEGEVGKTCLMDALLGDEWQEHPSTHGIEIKSFQLTHPDTQTEITLNGWDFGGQRVYRPTHQLFFSAPAVYLVVWKPREGPQQGFVKEWIKLVKHREPDAKILVVATHGGPQQRQPDIDRQELWDLFGRGTVADFFFVDSKPNAHGNRKGIEELKLAIARLAAGLPEVGRSVPKSFQDVREALQASNVPYLPLDEVLAICRAHKMDDEIARLFITISHRLGHLTHYQHDPALRDIVILRPDWLATAISYIFDDEVTRAAHGLVRFSRLNHLWDDPTRGADSRYPANLHPIFLRLMERFDLSYRVADPTPRGESDPQSLIAQLVPDNRPENFGSAWISSPSSGDLQQAQICRIVDDKGNSAPAEGLFYQLIVRLHKYSLGRAAYADSVHWQRGLVLDDDYNGRALLEHKGNDVHITVRAPYPERFLAMLTEEVKYLVESFWEGLRCDVMVPCLNETPCIGLFEVRRLIENKKAGRPEQPCPVCNVWQNIDSLLLNAPAARPISTTELVTSNEVLSEVRGLRRLVSAQHLRQMNKFGDLEAKDKEILSKIDVSYYGLMQALTDEAKEGPRLFSLVPIDRRNFNPKEWIRAKFRLTLWCEHSRQPLTSPDLNGKDSKKGVYEFEIDREWFKKTAPFLKILTGTLSLILPVASSGIKFALDDAAYKLIEEDLDFGKSVIDAAIGEGTKIGEWMGDDETIGIEHGDFIHAQGAKLREFHSLLKSLDKSENFGGLIRVMNKRQEFMWVHERFAGEY